MLLESIIFCNCKIYVYILSKKDSSILRLQCYFTSRRIELINPRRHFTLDRTDLERLLSERLKHDFAFSL